jgi:hypothetical protein
MNITYLHCGFVLETDDYNDWYSSNICYLTGHDKDHMTCLSNYNKKILISF